MRVHFDTSVLVAGLVRSHPKYREASAALLQARSEEVQASISAHTLAEFYATLSRMPLKPKVSPGAAVAQLRENILPYFEVVTLDLQDYTMALERLSRLGLPGAIIFDALIGRAAEKVGARRLLTLNTRDFDRLGLDLEAREP
ncbi:MAG: PIN domain-containing protein [Acidobacteria bacterium]|nr:PIN domain-containing protein [Acidobacteriota bacterium]